MSHFRREALVDALLSLREEHALRWDDQRRSGNLEEGRRTSRILLEIDHRLQRLIHRSAPWGAWLCLAALATLYLVLLLH